ncbi:MAG TPA: hypothetical protein VIZ90_01770, partial [Rhizobiaceae bacterium]
MRSLGRIAGFGALFVLAGVSTAMSAPSEKDGKLTVNQCMAAGGDKLDCLCDATIRSGSELALQRFLRRYPDADTICNALAATAPEAVNEHGDGSRIARKGMDMSGMDMGMSGMDMDTGMSGMDMDMGMSGMDMDMGMSGMDMDMGMSGMDMDTG